jgi:hypothetical protein
MARLDWDGTIILKRDRETIWCFSKSFLSPYLTDIGGPLLEVQVS